MTPFTDTQNDKLVELVRIHPILWNTADEQFKRHSHKRDLVWKEIGQSVNRTAKDCKTRWRSIKDHRLRQKKQDESGSRSRKIASYWRKLDFLDAVDADNEEEQPAMDNEHVYLDAFEVDIDQPTNRSEETSEAQKKKKKIQKDDDSDYLMELLKPREEHVTQSRKRIHESLSQNDDEIDLFFKAMAATVKKFTFEEQVETKSQVFNIINKIEGRSLKQ